MILQTKLHIPSVAANLVLRRRLFAQLESDEAQRITLVLAPAGFGKTTLVADWIHTTNKPTAWLSLDQEDNEPIRFLRHLLAAVAKRFPTIDSALQSLGQASHSLAVEPVIVRLINALSEQATSITLVLDDYHLITEPSIHKGIDLLLERAPSQLHVIITSRSRPPLALTRLHARGQMIEVTSNDLRFTVEETATFLHQRVDTVLEKDAITLLRTRTEGWVVGLQFSALALQRFANPGERDAFIAALTGRNRDITDYLLSEVLHRQSATIQQFLLSTSILTRFNGDLCDALLGLPYGNGQMQLEELERRNLFLVPLDSERNWYRYHHLFADLLHHRLQQQLPAADITLLHRRASQWFERNELMEEAIEQALQGQDMARAAHLIEMMIPETLWGQAALPRLRRWLEALPNDLLIDFPQLVTTGAFMALLAHDMARITTYLAIIDRVSEVPPEIEAGVAMVRSAVNRTRGKHVDVDALEALLEQLPEDALNARIIVLVELSSYYYSQNDLQADEPRVREILRLAQRAENFYMSVEAMIWLGRITQEHGELHQAAREYERALTLAEEYSGPFSPSVAHAHLALADLYYEWNELTRAAEHYGSAIEISVLADVGDYIWWGYRNQARLFHAMGNMAAATQSLQSLKAHAQKVATKNSPYDPMVVFAEVEVEFALRNLELGRVERWLQTQSVGINHLPNTITGYHWLLATYLIQQSRQSGNQTQLPAVVHLLTHLRTMADERGYTSLAISLRLLLAQAYQLQRTPNEALAMFKEALAMAESGGYVRTFVDYGEPIEDLVQVARHQNIIPHYCLQLLAAFSSSPHRMTAHADRGAVASTLSSGDSPSPLVEPLTARESEVLQLIVQGLTNQEIADRLIISVATVKRHVYNIYGKLGVKHRAQAIARANALALLSA